MLTSGSLGRVCEEGRGVGQDTLRPEWDSDPPTGTPPDGTRSELGTTSKDDTNVHIIYTCICRS